MKRIEPRSPGYTFGSWKVLNTVIHRNKWTTARFYHVKCLCGYEAEVASSNLELGTSRQCKACCKQKHGIDIKVVGTLREKYYDAKYRCTDPTHMNWPYYGARGIKMCFSTCLDFLLYVKTLPDYNNLSLQLDRIDNNRHYEPGNLRFVTPKVNANNRRS